MVVKELKLQLGFSFQVVDGHQLSHACGLGCLGSLEWSIFDEDFVGHFVVALGLVFELFESTFEFFVGKFWAEK